MHRPSRVFAFPVLALVAGLGLLSACAAPTPATPTAAKPASSDPTSAKPAASPAASPATASSQAAPPIAAREPVAKLPDFPTKTIEIIVPFPPGGGYDAVARQLAIPMQKELGQPIVIKNVPGGGGHIAARQFQQAAGDGYTMAFFSDGGIYIDSLMQPTEGFDQTTWQWVAGVRSQPTAVFVRNDSPFKSIEDVIAADSNGQRLRFGHNGVAGGYLPMQVIFTSALELKNAAFIGGFGGTADIIPALVRGDIDIQVVRPVSSVMQFVRNGDIRPLMVYPADGISLLPSVPTARALNLSAVADFEATGLATIGFQVVGSVPAERLKVLEQATLNALHDPDFLTWARESGVGPDIKPQTAEEMRAAKAAEYAIWNRYEAAIRQHAG